MTPMESVFKHRVDKSAVASLVQWVDVVSERLGWRSTIQSDAVQRFAKIL